MPGIVYTNRVLKTLSTIPLTPFLARKGEKSVSGGYPRTPSKGLRPSAHPFFIRLLRVRWSPPTHSGRESRPHRCRQ